MGKTVGISHVPLSSIQQQSMRISSSIAAERGIYSQRSRATLKMVADQPRTADER